MTEIDYSCSLYRMLDADDALLYIGVTRNLAARRWEHKTLKPWYDQVVRVTSEPFSSRIEAEKAELHAIQNECPRYNVAGRSRPFLPSHYAVVERADLALKESARTYAERWQRMRGALEACIDEQGFPGALLRDESLNGEPE